MNLIKKTFNNFSKYSNKYNISIKMLICVLISFSILMSLSIWQLKRKIYKEQLQYDIKSSLSNNALTIENITKEDHKNNNIKSFKKYEAIGYFDIKNLSFIYGRKSRQTNKDGYYILIPFITKHHKIWVLTNWVDAKNRDILLHNIQKIDDIENHKNQNNIKYSVKLLSIESEKSKFFLPKNDIKNNIWFTIDTQEAQKYFDLTVSKQYFLLLNNNDENQNYNNGINNSKYFNNVVKQNITSRNLIKIRNDHLEYAITWFSLGLALIIIYLLYIFNQIKKPNNKI